MKFVYKRFLKEHDLELVIFSDVHDDAIVFDTCLDDDGRLSQLSDRVVFFCG